MQVSGFASIWFILMYILIVFLLVMHAVNSRCCRSCRLDKVDGCRGLGGV